MGAQNSQPAPGFSIRAADSSEQARNESDVHVQVTPPRRAENGRSFSWRHRLTVSLLSQVRSRFSSQAIGIVVDAQPTRPSASQPSSAARSLPASLQAATHGEGVKCPACSKQMSSDEITEHLLKCLENPPIFYNREVLSSDNGECVICFDELTQGNIAARLPCLCIFHKKCIDSWFEKNRCCPSHPDLRALQ